ncbi:hypothetical protein P5P86_15450 [Nocardioides sp. BP30]|uniref:hypothetical protein n=1 Tax=Nocardioides sp. BP30 TaxID=3036374 RepID=UPI0024695EA3|nr:hypothetical protein [Nocardioides sp. BP30]WGL51349.1 hypothetical protein P5P86_15450 [Nocardioides sp. BP30]
MAEPEAPVKADLPPPSKMLKGHTVYRVVWKLNTDVLVGYCWCGTAHEATDPIELWDWLLAHPATHGREDDRADIAPAPVSPDRELVRS